MESRLHRKGIWLVLGLLLACVSFDLLVYFQPDLWNHNSEYQWRVLRHGRKSMIVPVALLWSGLMSIALLGFRRLAKSFSGRKLDGWAAVLIFVLGILSPLVFFQVNRFGAKELLVRVLVEDHTGYFSDAVKFKSRAALNAAYRENLASLSMHGRTHPPMNALLFMALNRLSARSDAWQGLYQRMVKEEVRDKLHQHFGAGTALQAAAMLALLLMLAAVGLSAVLGYFLVRRFCSAEQGFLSMLALICLPAFSAKTPVMDQVYAVFILTAALTACAHKKGSLWHGLLSGFIIGVGAWLSPSVWSGVFLLPLLVLARELGAEPRKKFREVYESLLVLGLSGFAGAGFALWLGSLVTKLNYLEVFQLNRTGWFLNNTFSGRIHVWKWVLFNPYEYFFWASLPIFLGAVVQFVKSSAIIKKSWPELPPMHGFFAAALLFAAILNLSGQICYESPRLCWFFLPILANFSIAGFSNFTQNFHSKIWYLVLTLISLQTAVVLAIY